MIASDYYGITAAQRQHGCDYAQAQRKLIEMVATGVAEWWPGMTLIAVNRGVQGQLPLGASSGGIY